MRKEWSQNYKMLRVIDVESHYLLKTMCKQKFRSRWLV